MYNWINIIEISYIGANLTKSFSSSLWADLIITIYQKVNLKQTNINVIVELILNNNK